MEILLEETEMKMVRIGKGVSDIKWIGSSSGEWEMTWAEFASAAEREYDNSYGSAKVAIDLVIVFTDNTWMTRGEYDGSEWWVYHKPPVQVLPTDRTTIGRVVTREAYGCELIEEMNERVM